MWTEWTEWTPWTRGHGKPPLHVLHLLSVWLSTFRHSTTAPLAVGTWRLAFLSSRTPSPVTPTLVWVAYGPNLLTFGCDYGPIRAIDPKGLFCFVAPEGRNGEKGGVAYLGSCRDGLSPVFSAHLRRLSIQ